MKSIKVQKIIWREILGAKYLEWSYLLIGKLWLSLNYFRHSSAEKLLPWESTYLLFKCTTYLEVYKLEVVQRETKIILFKLLRRNLGLLGPLPLTHIARVGRREAREIYFTTSKKSLLGSAIQEMKFIVWMDARAFFAHFCLGAHILHWGCLWRTKRFSLKIITHFRI